MRTAAAILLFGVAACSGFRLRVPSSAGAPADGVRGPRAGPSVARAGGARSGSEVRRICRGSRLAGWIAIDYVSDSIGCPAVPGRRSSFGTALVMRYDDLPVGEELSVCAGERVPSNWSRERLDPEDARCPRAPSEQGSTAPTVMVIRRVR